MRDSRFARRLVVSTLAGVTAFTGLATPAQAAEPAFQLPFTCGEVWKGNNPSSGAHRTDWELDFNLGSGAQDRGKPVLAAAAGTVETAAYQKDNGFGNLVKIRHGSSGYHTYYAHLDDMAVDKGEAVSQGQLIGWVGNTSETNPGISPHLHYEVRQGASGYPGNIRPATFNGTRFPYPTGSLTSKNCGSAPVKAGKSINGDKYDDAVAVDSDGVAWMYPGTSGGGFGTRVRIGPGWGGFGRIGIGDANADGWAELFATNSTGGLYHWGNRGNGTFSSGVQVGSGWTAVDYFSVSDVNGDNKADIVTRDGGNLKVYTGKGTGGFSAPALVGPGWSAYPRHTVADADGDGDGDIWAISSAGALSFWKRNGDSFGAGDQVGSGWSGFGQLTTMDINGDNKADIVAVRSSDGTLWQWLGTGNGTFGQAAQIGSGWLAFRLGGF